MDGAKVYFYRPPSVLDVERKTRKAKHIDHYVGPATIVKRIGSRSFQISFFNPSTGVTQLLQRDAGMIILKKEWIAPSIIPLNSRLEPTRHQKGMELRVGEMVIMLDYPESRDWYVAEISQVLHDRFTVNGYITNDIGWISPGVEEAETGSSQRSRLSQDLVQGQRQRNSNDNSTETSQRIREVLVEMEASDR